LTVANPAIDAPTIAGEPPGRWMLARVLAVLLAVDGIARLVLLIFAIGAAAPFVHWPLGRLDVGYLAVTRGVLAYALLAAVPPRCSPGQCCDDQRGSAWSRPCSVSPRCCSSCTWRSSVSSAYA
jgi:hypothetical protein